MATSKTKVALLSPHLMVRTMEHTKVMDNFRNFFFSRPGENPWHNPSAQTYFISIYKITKIVRPL